MSYNCELDQQEQDLLSRETRLAEANRVIREQSQPRTVGPTLPGAAVQDRKRPAMALPQPTQPTGPELVPEAKRARVDTSPPVFTLPPPPLPTPPGTAPAVPSQTEDFFTSAGSSGTPTAATQGKLVPEEVFAVSLGKPAVTLQIRVPNDPAQMAWNFYGQIVSISIDVMKSVKDVKEEISRAHLNGMPPKKIQLKNTATGLFMKDALTLAALNIGPTATLELVPRARGGRK